MFLNEDLSKDLKPEQIQAIETAYTTKEAELKSMANKNADAILNGFAEKLSTITGVARKGTDEKVSQHFERIVNEWLPEVAKPKLSALEKERDEWKIKFEKHEGDATLKTELEKYKAEIAKIPDLLKNKEDEWKAKYTELETNHKNFKFSKSMADAMPQIDSNVNPFEAKAKQQNAIDRIKQTYELSYDDKDNLIGTKDYQKYLVADLLKNDEELKGIILTEQGGIGGGGAQGGKRTTKTLNLPEGIGKGAAQQLIQEYIISVENIGQLDSKFSDRFKELCKENNVL
jgi:hypothetical protein